MRKNRVHRTAWAERGRGLNRRDAGSDRRIFRRGDRTEAFERANPAFRIHAIVRPFPFLARRNESRSQRIFMWYESEDLGDVGFQKNARASLPLLATSPVPRRFSSQSALKIRASETYFVFHLKVPFVKNSLRAAAVPCIRAFR